MMFTHHRHSGQCSCMLSHVSCDMSHQTNYDLLYVYDTLEHR